VLAVIVSTILFLVTSYLIGALAVPPATLKVVPADNVCPNNLDTYNAFCSYISLSNGGQWVSYIANFNKTNLYIEVTGEFHVNNFTNNNTEG
jgi:hypothetical protein